MFGGNALCRAVVPRVSVADESGGGGDSSNVQLLGVTDLLPHILQHLDDGRDLSAARRVSQALRAAVDPMLPPDLPRCAWSELARRTAQQGRVDLLEWAISRGAPLSEVDRDMLPVEAAASGHVDVLQWAARNDVALTGWVIDSAIEHGQVEALDWAWAHTPDIPYDEEDVFERAEHFEQPTVAAWAERMGLQR